MTELTVSAKGWVVIPADLRRKYELAPGAKVIVVDYGGVLALVPALDRPLEQSAGILAGGRSLTRALKRERQRERRRGR